MKLKYENTIEDIVALGRSYRQNSPMMKRAKYNPLFFVWTVLITASLTFFLFDRSAFTFQKVVVISICASAAILFSALFLLIYPAMFDRCMRRSATDDPTGASKFLCEHELEMDDSGIVERTDVNESHTSWRGIQRIAETDEYGFICLSATTAHVIPKKRIVEGDPDAFIRRAKELCRIVNPTVILTPSSGGSTFQS